MTTIAKFERDFNNNIMGYSAIGIILSTCLGGIAIMGSLTHGLGAIPMFLVMLSVIVCSVHNAAILTVQKPTLIYRLLIISVIVNSLIIAVMFMV